MADKIVISMDRDGGLTLPASARRALHLAEETEFEVEVAGEVIILRPIVPRDEDDWAYEPEHQRLVRQARVEGADGQARTLTEDDLRTLAPAG